MHKKTHTHIKNTKQKKNKWMKTRLRRETQISDCVSLKGFPVYSVELTKKEKKNESSWVKNE